MKAFKRIWALILCVGLVLLLNQNWGMVPAMGMLLNPFDGFFAQIEGEIQADRREVVIDGLLDEVQIKYDQRAVPHIFAQNDHDLYFAQGYVLAKDRLWQMEFYTLLAAGRLTEVIGENALRLDQYHRRMGLAKTASLIVSNLEAQDSVSWSILKAYSEGVNAYLKTLTRRNLPLEYKILGYEPESWTPYKSILMLMNMRLTLSSGSHDFSLSKIAAKHGLEVVNDLFPNYPSLESPIIPEGTSWGFDAVDVPPVPEQFMASVYDADSAQRIIPSPDPNIGSNNWAVSGSRSLSGLPILANDPHLQLTLPSIWYEIQLHSPDVNVYGVALPGAPAVIIGYNKDVAWGVTNTGSDVLDYYRIAFKDEKKEEFWYENAWRPVNKRLETYKIKGKKAFIDTVLVTHHGVIVDDRDSPLPDNHQNVGHAMRWMGNESFGSDLLTFHYLNRAKTYEDYRDALKSYVSPAQNFIFASNEDDISITINGALPLKWKEQGKFILDGANPAHEWGGWIDFERNPTVRNPERGFVSSANQFPTDQTYPYYLGWRFAMPSRAIRINERLEAMEGATADSFIDLLNDNYNVDARRILPMMLQHLNSNDSIANTEAYELLKNWNLDNSADQIAASIFETWIPLLRKAIWEEKFPVAEGFIYPDLDRTYSLLLDGHANQWTELIQQSFVKVLSKLEEEYGPLNQDTWNWANVKSTEINHLVPQFVSFSRKNIRNGGGARIVNATTKIHGPSWKMVVELSESYPRAYGLFPGGQSGNPGSRYYDNMIERWAEGKLDTLLYFRDEHDFQELTRRVIIAKPKKS